MADLEVKTRMSALQLAIVITLVVVGAPGRVMYPLLREAGHAAWLAVLAGAGLFCGVALLILKLGEYFPDESFAEYLPRIFGRWLGGTVVWLFVLVFFLLAVNVLQSWSREITFFMFDRTPFEVVEASLLAVAAYCALQDWGTILRVAQLIFFTAFPLWLLLLSTGLLGFRFLNFLPLWPEDAAGVATAALHSWSMFGGYECILLFLPLVYKANIRPARAVAGAFGLATAIFLLWIMLEIGVLTLEGAKNTPFPLLTIIRITEIPGTFLERLDTYFLLFWIQAIFASVTLQLYFMAQALTLLYRYADHRPFVLALIPPLFLVADAAHHVRIYEGLKLVSGWAGLVLSLGVVPLLYAYIWWRRRRSSGGKSSQA